MNALLGTATCPQIAAHRDLGGTYFAAFYNRETNSFVITSSNPQFNLDMVEEFNAEQAYEEWNWMTGKELYELPH